MCSSACGTYVADTDQKELHCLPFRQHFYYAHYLGNGQYLYTLKGTDFTLNIGIIPSHTYPKFEYTHLAFNLHVRKVVTKSQTV